MSLENFSRKERAGEEQEPLDALLDRATSPAENPWFATQVLNRARLQPAPREGSFREKLLRAVFMPRMRFVAGFAALAVATVIFLDRAQVRDATPLVADPPPITTFESSEITDDFIVADLEIFVAELNSELWQNDHTL